MGIRDIAYFARSQECLSKSICCIALKAFLGKLSAQHSIKDGLGGALCNRVDTVNQYKKSEHKWKKELKFLNKHKKMIYRISKKSGFIRELKKIKNINSKSSQKHSYSSRNSSISGSDSDSSLSSDSYLEEQRQHTERKQMNTLDRVVTDNIKTNKYQFNDAI